MRRWAAAGREKLDSRMRDMHNGEYPTWRVCLHVDAIQVEEGDSGNVCSRSYNCAMVSSDSWYKGHVIDSCP
jgi:hypothetical protein